ncbi:MAG: DUF4345 family protein [Notoacmeibacter sp.]|nr:DUF4345 family protein [Notoacmeibacter sp.]
MEFAFPWPFTTGEWLAWSSAAATVFIGLVLLFMPRLALGLLRLQPVPGRPEAVAQGRATMAGFYLGVGAVSILLAQPSIYLALAAGWTITAFGRIISMLSDGGNRLFNWILLAVEIALGVLAGAYPLGFIP